MAFALAIFITGTVLAVLTVSVLFRGTSQRLNRPKEEMQQQIGSLEERVRDLEEKDQR
ncbi:hypothetical protein [Lentibacillus sediminis]|uniref:hypothetical protein n=1 Tax=Lentibacillus sediminis TaxID=1940529 RepID=UPI00130410F0|nr:hypothetical protein [Lentibacillus sediminis]